MNLRKAVSINEVDALENLTTQVSAFARKFDAFGVNVMERSSTPYDQGSNQVIGFCSSNVEFAQYIANPNRYHNNPHSNFYNLGWKNHPHLSWVTITVRDV